MARHGKTLEQILAAPESSAQMKRVEVEVAKVCNQFKDNTEAMIVVFALIRVACQLLNLYRPNTRRLMVETVLAPKLYGEHRDEGLLFQ
jgi:hypothetical protein